MKLSKLSINSLLSKANVNLICEKDGKIIIGVEKKIPLELLEIPDRVPVSINGIETDVIETGKIEALQSRTDKWRPAPGGVSIGHYAITAGTLGMLVIKNDITMILSNNHVLADCNRGIIGDRILQPGRVDIGGNGNGNWCPLTRAYVWLGNKVAEGLGRNVRIMAYRPKPQEENEYLIAYLHKYVPIDFIGGFNKVDCALAVPVNQEWVSSEVLEIGIPVGFIQAKMGDKVRKSGRTSEYNEGEVLGIDAIIKVSYGENRVAIFENQLWLTHMLDPGDSGSIIFDKNETLAKGLGFAGSDSYSWANNIWDVIDELGGFECPG